MLHKAFWVMPNGLRELARRMMRRTLSVAKIRFTETERENIRMKIADGMRQFGPILWLPSSKVGFLKEQRGGRSYLTTSQSNY